jgi:hypothetical protein
VPGATISFALNKPGSDIDHPSLGEDNEVSVARVLWQLYDRPAYAGIAGSVDFIKTLAGAMSSNARRNLFNAVDALEHAEKSEPWDPDPLGPNATNAEVPVHYHEAAAVTTFGAVLSDQDVAPTIMTAEFAAAENSVTVEWKSGQPSTADDRLDQFLVQIWSSDWMTLITERARSGARAEIKGGESVFDATLKLPPGIGSGDFHLVILGWNTQAPFTGPYVSQAHELKVP